MARQMFYDRLMGRVKPILDDPTTYREGLKEGRRILANLESQAKVFFIDAMTLDSLVNCNYKLLENDPGLTKLPFPHMFFEFESVFEYRRKDDGPKDKFKLNGFLFSPLDRRTVSANVRELIPDDRWDMQGFSIFSFGDRGDGLADGPYHMAHFFDDSKELFVNEFLPISAYHSYMINLDIHPSVEEFERLQKEDPRLFASVFEEGDFIDQKKMPNLIINLIDYIKAENITMVHQRGEGKHKGKPKKLRSPYYTIELKRKNQYTKSDFQGDGPQLDYRVWVIGHTQKYHTNEGIIRRWIIPYIRGPENAPWKNNRYLMLYKNFRHRLASRGNEDLGTSLDK